MPEFNTPDGTYDWNRAGVQVTVENGNVWIPDDSADGGTWYTGDAFMEYNERVDRQEQAHADAAAGKGYGLKRAVDSFADLVRKD